jgi:hypothetical protein
MSTELQDALEWVPAMEQDIRDNALDEYLGQCGVDMLKVIVKAATSRPPLDIDAAIEARFNYITTGREDVTQIVNAALGITEAT